MTMGVVRLGIEGLPFFPIWCQRVAAALAMANSGLGLVETALQDEPGDCLGSFLFPGMIPWGEGIIQPCPDILESCALSQKLQAILISARSGLLMAKWKRLDAWGGTICDFSFKFSFFYTNGILHMYYILLKIRKKKSQKRKRRQLVLTSWDASSDCFLCIYPCLFSYKLNMFFWQMSFLLNILQSSLHVFKYSFALFLLVA